jgi:uncharacterized protein YuzE
MSITIDDTTFHSVHYDAGGDVLYLQVDPAQIPTDYDASPEGHALRFDNDGKLIGVTIVNAKWTLEHEGHVTITLPKRLDVDASTLGAALTAA